MCDPFDELPDAQTAVETGRESPLRVLVVDDSAMTRAMVRRSVTLSGVDATVEEAPDGQAAIEKLRGALAEGRPFDVCFLDLNMPRVGGIEVARAVHDDAAMPTQVVIVSSEAMAGRIRQLQESGVSGYVRKPFKPEQIRQVLCGVLAPATSAATAAA